MRQQQAADAADGEDEDEGDDGDDGDFDDDDDDDDGGRKRKAPAKRTAGSSSFSLSSVVPAAALTRRISVQ